MRIRRPCSFVTLEKLLSEPFLFGKTLAGDLKAYRKLRFGPCRVICSVEGSSVKIDKIGHRSTVYKEAMKRLKKKGEA